MRALARVGLLILLALPLALSGCTTPKGEKPTDQLFGLCPQWTQGPGGQTTGFHMTPAEPKKEYELGPAEATWQNHTLDIYRVRLVEMNVTGRLEMRGFSADDKQLMVRDYRTDSGAQMVPVIAVGDGDRGQEFDIILSSVRHNSPSAQTPIRAEWTLEGEDASVEYTVTYHYKVCGAAV